MFQANEVVELTLVEENIRLCATIRHTDGQRLLIAVEPQDAPHIVPGQQIHLVQALPEGLYLVDTQVVNRRDNLFVAQMRTPQLIQRRRNPRADCDMPALYGLNLTLAALAELRPGEAEKGIVRDLSQGGLRMLTKELICAQAVLGISFTLADNEIGDNGEPSGVINVEASVVRCSLLEPPEPAEQGTLEYAVAVKFARVTRIDQIRIQKFLFMHH